MTDLSAVHSPGEVPVHSAAGECFLALLPSDLRSTVDTADLDRELERVFAACRARWPLLDVPEESYLAYMAARVGPGGPQWNRVQFPDLYLACACARGEPAAIGLFERYLGKDIDAILSRLTPRADVREEARQRLFEHLFVGTAERPARLLEYEGRGELGAFVRVVVSRIALGLLRRELLKKETHRALMGRLDVDAGQADSIVHLIASRWYEWDYGGTVVFDGTRLASAAGLLWLRTSPTKVDYPNFEELMGNQLIDSSNARLREAEPVVYEVVAVVDPSMLSPRL